MIAGTSEAQWRDLAGGATLVVVVPLFALLLIRDLITSARRKSPKKTENDA